MPTQVINQSKNNQIVCMQTEMAKNPWTRLKGLMFREGLPEGHGLWIEPCSDIHSCFMRFEFDAVFLDKKGKVLHTISKMKPWGMSGWIKGTRVVLELDGGVVEATQTEVGDQLILNPT